MPHILVELTPRGRHFPSEKGLSRLHLDTGPVRPGEELSLPLLADWLRGRIAGAERGITLEQFPSRHSNLTYRLQIDGLEYVLRRGPLRPVAPKAHDMGREFRVLEMVHPHFQEAPNVFQRKWALDRLT